MNCEQCKIRPATVHLTKIINNQKTSMNLCEKCAGTYHDFSAFGGNFSIHKLLTGFLNQAEGDKMLGFTRPEAECRQCGLTLSQFSHFGKLGCSECYPTFKDNIRPLLRKIHGTNLHQGKVPKRTGQSFRVKREIEKLKNDLQLLIQHEEFEKAATVRDKIKELEKEAKLELRGDKDEPNRCN
jgi:protein arginine kinase activator